MMRGLLALEEGPRIDFDDLRLRAASVCSR